MARPNRARDAILGCFEQGGEWRRSRLIEACVAAGVSAATANNALFALFEDGYIWRVRSGVYRRVPTAAATQSEYST